MSGNPTQQAEGIEDKLLGIIGLGWWIKFEKPFPDDTNPQARWRVSFNRRENPFGGEGYVLGKLFPGEMRLDNILNIVLVQMKKAEWEEENEIEKSGEGEDKNG